MLVEALSNFTWAEALLQGTQGGGKVLEQVARLKKSATYGLYSQKRDQVYENGKGNLTAAREFALKQLSMVPAHPVLLHLQLATLEAMLSVDAADVASSDVLYSSAVTNFEAAMMEAGEGFRRLAQIMDPERKSCGDATDTPAYTNVHWGLWGQGSPPSSKGTGQLLQLSNVGVYGDAGVAVPYAGCDIYIVASDPYLDLTTQVPLLVPSLQRMIVHEPWKNHAGMRETRPKVAEYAKVFSLLQYHTWSDISKCHRCQQSYQDPVSLPCGHIVCRRCTEPRTCPFCHMSFVIPSNGTKGFRGLSGRTASELGLSLDAEIAFLLDSQENRQRILENEDFKELFHLLLTKFSVELGLMVRSSHVAVIEKELCNSEIGCKMFEAELLFLRGKVGKLEIHAENEKEPKKKAWLHMLCQRAKARVQRPPNCKTCGAGQHPGQGAGGFPTKIWSEDNEAYCAVCWREYFDDPHMRHKDCSTRNCRNVWCEHRHKDRPFCPKFLMGAHCGHNQCYPCNHIKEMNYEFELRMVGLCTDHVFRKCCSYKKYWDTDEICLCTHYNPTHPKGNVPHDVPRNYATTTARNSSAKQPSKEVGRKCETCKNDFVPSNPGHEYCDSCYQQAKKTK